MTPQEFLKQNRYNLSPEEYNSALDDLSNMDNDSWGKKYNDIFSEKTTGWYELKQQFKPLQKRFVSSFGTSDRTNPFARPKAELDDIYRKNYADVPREQFDSMLKNMSQYWEDEKKARDYEAGKYKREQEVKDWGWRNLIASDYEKQRYINEPQKAILGEEAPSIGEAPETRGMALADLGIGAAALGADVGTSFLKMNPITFGIATVTGPAIRGTRDILHKAVDSPYQKEGLDIVKDVLTDIKSNAEIEGLANLRQLSRMVRGISNGPISTVLKNEESIGNLKKQLDNFPVRTELPDVSNSDLFEMIQKLPSDSPFRQALQPYAKDIYNIDRAGIADEIDRARKQVDLFENPDLRKAIKTVADYDLMPTPRIGERQFEQQIMSTPSLTRAQLAGKTALKTAEKIPSKSGGVLKAAAVGARKESVPEPEQLTRDWYLKNYEHDWDMGFRPKKKENDPKWEAYREYYINKYGTEPEEE